MQAWEYKLVSMGNPLEPDIGLRANVLGKQGWQLVAVDAGVWIFMRPATDDPLTSAAAQAIIEETVPIVEDTVSVTPAPTSS